MPRSARNPIGAHVRVVKGLAAGALAHLSRIGGAAAQVFVGNPRGWALSPGDPDQDAAFRAACERDGIPAFVHAPYLVNVGSPTLQTYELSVESIGHNLRRAATIGARGVVVHTGSCVDEGGFDVAMRQVRKGLLPLLEELDPDGPRLLLEPTAGQGRSLCASVDDLGRYLDMLDRHPMAGICLDTCHVFAAGAPLDEPGGATGMLDQLVEVAGAERLGLVHANDSKDGRGTHHDRHERIGLGRIGDTAFAEMFAHPATEGVPFVAETPGDETAIAEDIARLVRLRDGD
ncbi:MAG: deoxyribonuclease IV [Nocardioidaceae bacterium]